MINSYGGIYTLEHFHFNGESYDSIAEEFDSLDILFKSIQDLWIRHSAEKSDAGITVILTNQSGAQLQLGLADEGCLVIIEPKKQFHIVRADNTSRGDRHVAFLLPSWTEFPNDAILPSDMAITLSRDYILGKNLSLRSKGLHIRNQDSDL